MNKVISYFFYFFQIIINFSGIYTKKYILDINENYKTVLSSSNSLIICWLFLFSLEFYIIFYSKEKIYKNIRLYLHLSQLFNLLWLLSYFCEDFYLVIFNSFVLYLIHFFYITKQHILLKEKDIMNPVIKKYMYFSCAWISITFFQNLSIIMLLYQFQNMSIITLFIGFILSNIYIFGENTTFLITYYIYLIDKIFW